MGDPTLADAILDGLVHNPYRVGLKSKSMSKRMARLTYSEVNNSKISTLVAALRGMAALQHRSVFRCANAQNPPRAGGAAREETRRLGPRAARSTKPARRAYSRGAYA